MVRSSDEVELKFNPWHDPADGRFTFAGGGNRFGAGGTGPSDRRSADRPKKDHHADKVESRAKVSPSSHRDKPNAVTEFVGGVGEGLYDTAANAVESVRSLVATNPATTVRNLAYGAAGLVDAATTAENTPALAHIAEGRKALANASARDVGRAAGSIAGNGALAAAPGAALSKVSALRRLRMVPPRVTYDPPQIGWAKERHNSKKAWVKYNDGAPGARSGQAPTLIRTMPDGSRRPVKFDGVEEQHMIDRKFKVVDSKKSRDQALRQSHALRENGIPGIWEVTTAKNKKTAFKVLKKVNVKNIKVRIVLP